jgi:hypothetical protein
MCRYDGELRGSTVELYMYMYSYASQLCVKRL